MSNVYNRLKITLIWTRTISDNTTWIISAKDKRILIDRFKVKWSVWQFYFWRQ